MLSTYKPADDIVRKHLLAWVWCCLLLAVVLPVPSHAEISVVSHFRGGEDDGAVAGMAAQGITDIVGQRDMSCTTTPPTPVFGEGLYPASSSSVLTPAGSGCSSPDGFTFTNNFGYEAFFRIEDVSAQDDFFVNGRGSFDGFGFTTKTLGAGIEYRGYFGGVAFLPTGILAEQGDVVYMAVVRDGGQTRLYFKDMVEDTALQVFDFGSVGPNPAIGGFGVALNDGYVDDLRVFTFNPGEFDPDQDLLVHQANLVCTEPVPGIVSWLTGDTGASDLWNLNNGVLLNGATAGVPGFVDNGFSLDGDDDHILIADAPGVDFLHRFSVEATINPTTLDDPSQVGTIAAKWQVPSSDRSWVFGVFNSGQLFFMVSSGQTDEYVLSDAVVPTGVFTHVAATFDSGEVRLYVDGVEEIKSLPIQSLGQTSNPLSIGLRKQLNGDRLVFHGVIDELRLYDRVLSATEIADIVAAGQAGMCKDETPAELEEELASLKFREHPSTAAAAQAILLGSVEGPPATTDVVFTMEIVCPEMTLVRSCSVTPGTPSREVDADSLARLVCEYDAEKDLAKARLRYKSPIALGQHCDARAIATSGVFRLLDARLGGTLVE